jgi:hypothetical protein
MKWRAEGGWVVIAGSPHPFAMMNVRDVREAVAYPNILPIAGFVAQPVW